jgi:hypothetical protein
MIKRQVRNILKSVRGWLAEDQGPAATNGEDLRPLDAICKGILAHEPDRPNYVWGLVNAAALARGLDIERISVLELGVAGGNGLVALERAAERCSEAMGVQIDVYGFDSGQGLPKPTDYRDLPYLFAEGTFPMDTAKLRARLRKADLRLGHVEQTIPEFLQSNPAPIAFISFDLDLYSSTVHALRLLEAPSHLLLPRVYCYFDDILAFTYSEFTGELLAISEFNQAHEMRKISKINGLRYAVPSACRPGAWIEQVYVAHLFDHELYGRYDGTNPRTRLDLLATACAVAFSFHGA